MNINYELKKLIRKYGIYSIDNKYMLYNKICEILKEYVEGISDDKCIALRGGGEHSLMLLSGLEEAAEKIKYIVEKKNEKNDQFLQETIALKDINNYNIDIIIISSYKYRKEMKQELMDIGYKSEIIDIYDLLEEKYNIVLTTSFYDLIADGYNEIYDDLYDIRNSVGNIQEIAFRKVIAKYIKNRDFVNAFYFIDLYCENKFKDYIKYEKFKEECNSLFLDIKNKLEKKNMPHIVCNWIDAMMPNELEYADFLQHQIKRGIYFENSYTAVPYTSATFYTINTQKHVIENKWNPNFKFNLDTSELLIKLSEMGYEFKYCGEHLRKKLNKTNLSDKNYKSTKVVGYNSSYVPMSVYKWESLQLMLDTKMPLFIIVHIMETHSPFVSGKMEEKADLSLYCPFPYELECSDLEASKRGKQIIDSVNYIDSQLKWYSKFDSTMQKNIYMSDHGLMTKKEQYYDDLCKTVLIISGKMIPHKTYKQMFSIIKFKEIILHLIKNNYDMSDILSEFVKIEMIPPYHSKFVQRYINSNIINNDKVAMETAIAKKVYRSKDELYVLLETGDEYYYYKNNLVKDVENNEQYLSRVAYLREILGVQFVNVENNEDYKESRIIRDLFIKERKDFIELI